jgi:hypothetical protein
MTRKRAGILAGVAVIAAAGLGAGVAIAATSGGAPATTSTAASSPYGPGYSYYHSMMGRYFGGGSTMGGSGYGWMIGAAGYRWMFGGASAPAWMRGEQLPAAMMGTSTDPGGPSRAAAASVSKVLTQNSTKSHGPISAGSSVAGACTSKSPFTLRTLSPCSRRACKCAPAR